MRPLMQLGNRLSVTWRARLADHLGGFNVELLDPNAARVLDDQVALAAIRLRSPGLPSSCLSATRIRSFITARLRCLAALDDARLWPALLGALGNDAAPGSRLRPRFERMRRHRHRRRPDLCLAEIGQGGVARCRPALLRPAVEAPALPARGGPGTVTRRRSRRALRSPAISSSATCSAPRALALPQRKKRLVSLAGAHAELIRGGASYGRSIAAVRLRQSRHTRDATSGFSPWR